jgi:hypothetical protein
VNGVVSAKCDFRLPVELKSTVVRGRVLLPDGTPAESASVEIMSGTMAVYAGKPVPITDAAGGFWFAAMEGFAYRLKATRAGDVWWVSDEKHFSPDKDGPFVTPVLVSRAKR